MTRKKKKELHEKILETNRRRKMVVVGLVVGVALAILGQLVPFPALFIVGYTVFLICAGAISFFTVLKWQYTKALKEKRKEEAKLPVNVCPRCGTKVRKNTKYCPKCGKKIHTKKHQ